MLHAAVPGCNFVAMYQNTSNLEAHYHSAGLDHNTLANQLDEENFEREMRLQHEAEVRASSQHVQAAVQPDQLEEWLK